MIVRRGCTYDKEVVRKSLFYVERGVMFLQVKIIIHLLFYAVLNIHS